MKGSFLNHVDQILSVLTTYLPLFDILPNRIIIYCWHLRYHLPNSFGQRSLRMTPSIIMLHPLLFFIYTTELCTKCEYIIFMEYETIMTEHLYNILEQFEHLNMWSYFKSRLEGSSEKIIHRLKNPEVSNPITRGEAPSDWIGKTEGFFNLWIIFSLDQHSNLV